ncbi:PQQ-like beta-propeller repeat protein [soil metagenome]
MLINLTLILAAITSPDWREFRGPDGVGHYTGPKIVSEWGVDKNVAWKVPVPGKGWSSPILVKGKLILTTAIPKEDGSQKLHVLAFDAVTGKQLWDTEIFTPDAKLAGQMHKKNSHASPTPVSDGEKVWVHFGHMGTACLTFDGKEVWKTLKYTYGPVHGCGGSPILVDDMLVFSVDGKDKDQYVVALNKTTGAQIWKTDRKTTALMKFTFSTPQLITAEGRRMIVSPASDFVAAYDPKTGDELWRAKYPAPGWSVITRPIYSQGLVFVQTGYTSQHIIAIDPTGTGDITANIKWKNRKEATNTPTPMAVGKELYVVSDKGKLTCFDAKTGSIHWSEQLRGSDYSASPIYADGLLYFTSEAGVGQVVKAQTSGFEQVSQSDLKEKTFASFVPSDGAMFMRTETQLYRFEKK